ncbi:hypothetical protein QN239_07150 [Mycolicibacterium sp. Y3]
MASRRAFRAMRNGAFVAVVGAAVALGGAATAGAQPGLVDAQSGSTVDADGTQGTMVPAVTGDQRGLATQSTDGHTITSDACYVTGDGCMPAASFDPRTISATTGVSNDPDSVLDGNGFQTNTGG